MKYEKYEIVSMQNVSSSSFKREKRNDKLELLRKENYPEATRTFQ